MRPKPLMPTRVGLGVVEVAMGMLADWRCGQWAECQISVVLSGLEFGARIRMARLTLGLLGRGLRA